MKPSGTTYAEGTDVPVERSKAELDKLLEKHGAGQRAFFANDDEGYAVVMFSIEGRQIRTKVPLPTLDEIPLPRAGHRGKSQHEMHLRALEQKKRERWRERWRALVLVVKAKLEYVAMGVTSIEREFLADVALPDGSTVGDQLAGKNGELGQLYVSGKMPTSLLLGPATSKKSR